VKLIKHFNGNPPRAMLGQFRQIAVQIQVLNNENQGLFENLTRPLYATLYHEAFHAYLDNFVYPSKETAVPRWLNEGLAQIFETALVEGDSELRVGHVDLKRLAVVQEAIRKKELIPLADLLASENKQFSVDHASQAQASNRYFQASWALAYYLTFDRKLLNSEAMTKYVQSLQRGGSAAEAFRELVGQPLAEFEAAFHKFVLELRPEGTAKEP
jgi:hypothetical protein